MSKSPSVVGSAILASVGAVLLPVSLFLNWFKLDLGIEEEGVEEFSGWTALELTDAALVVLAALTIWLVIQRVRGSASVYSLLALGSVLLTITLTILITRTPLLDENVFAEASVSTELGAILATVGAGLVFVAGVLDAAVSYGAGHPEEVAPSSPDVRGPTS